MNNLIIAGVSLGCLFGVIVLVLLVIIIITAVVVTKRKGQSRVKLLIVYIIISGLLGTSGVTVEHVIGPQALGGGGPGGSKGQGAWNYDTIVL